MSAGILFIITAPSGAGKTTILRSILKTLAGLSFSVSHTTRPPRRGENNSIDYYFIDRDTFISMRERGDFIEWAEVHGNLYGTSKSAIADTLAKGEDIILDIDVQGANQVREKLPEAKTIFIAPPSMQELEKRLRGRASDSEEIIATRLANAKKELGEIGAFDFVIINDEIEQAIESVRSIIIAERSRARRHIDGSPFDLSSLN